MIRRDAAIMQGSSSKGHHFDSQLFNMKAESKNIEKKGGSILLTLHAKFMTLHLEGSVVEKL